MPDARRAWSQWPAVLVTAQRGRWLDAEASRKKTDVFLSRTLCNRLNRDAPAYKPPHDMPVNKLAKVHKDLVYVCSLDLEPLEPLIIIYKGVQVVYKKSVKRGNKKNRRAGGQGGLKRYKHST